MLFLLRGVKNVDKVWVQGKQGLLIFGTLLGNFLKVNDKIIGFPMFSATLTVFISSCNYINVLQSSAHVLTDNNFQLQLRKLKVLLNIQYALGD